MFQTVQYNKANYSCEKSIIARIILNLLCLVIHN